MGNYGYTMLRCYAGDDITVFNSPYIDIWIKVVLSNNDVFEVDPEGLKMIDDMIQDPRYIESHGHVSILTRHIISDVIVGVM